jgi:predicted ATP-grasp superfamily ATP-dependent carboligase
VEGLSCSASLVGEKGGARLLGVTEQLIGRATLGAGGFTWCGNLAPPRLPAAEAQALGAAARAIGERLVASFGLRGLFGVDMVWDGHRAWTVEVNPRPTAALEVLEAVRGHRTFDLHLRAFGARGTPGPSRLPTARAAGKGVLFAPEDMAVGCTDGWWERGVRDVPRSGERIARGRPVCTLLVFGEGPRE